MPALDKYHNAVVNALIKEEWTITNNPLRLTIGDRAVIIDIGAERLLAAEKGKRKIAVEVKTFGTPSPVADLQQAVGQFVMYEDILSVMEPDRELYLAIPEEVRLTIFEEELGRLMLNRRIRRLLCFSVPQEEIIEWLP